MSRDARRSAPTDSTPQDRSIDGFLDDKERQAFERGMELFQSGEWFEAHEVWEVAWRRCAGRRRRCYQVLIQAAVALEHRRRGNGRGAAKTLRRAVKDRDSWPSGFHSLDLRRLIAAVHDVMDDRATESEPAGEDQVDGIAILHAARATDR